MSGIIVIKPGTPGPLLPGVPTDSGPKAPVPFAQKIYLIEVHVAGTSYVENIEELEPFLTKGTQLKFFREPKNPHDPLAILIQDMDGHKIGYVPRSHNEILARLMDAGKLLYCTVYDKKNVSGWLQITIQIFLDD